MHKTIVYIAMSLDGYIAAENDDLSFLNPFGDVDYGYPEFSARIGAIIQGKRTFEIEMANGWENAHPVPVFVLTHQPPTVKPKRDDYFFTDQPIAEVLHKAKALTDKDIWLVGGGRVIQDFINAGLVDELVIAITPNLLGGGVRLFDTLDRDVALDLEHAGSYDRGLVILTYRVRNYTSSVANPTPSNLAHSSSGIG